MIFCAIFGTARESVVPTGINTLDEYAFAPGVSARHLAAGTSNKDGENAANHRNINSVFGAIIDFARMRVPATIQEHVAQSNPG